MSVFVSYRSVDRLFVDKLADALQSRGYDIWLDSRRITGHEPYWDEIQQAIEQCTVFIFVISPASLDKTSKAITELQHAASLPQPPVFIPVMAEKVDVRKFPILISPGRYQIQDFTTQSFENGITGVLRALGANSSEKTALDEKANPVTRASNVKPRLDIKRVLAVLGAGLALVLAFVVIFPESRRCQWFGGAFCPGTTPLTTLTVTATNTLGSPAALTATSTPAATPSQLGGGSGKIAFIRNGDVWIANVDGSEAKPILTSTSEEAAPAWSPDGKQIAFRSNRDGNFEIYVMGMDGSNLRRLTTDNAEDTNPTWSPDGKFIAYRSLKNGNAEIRGLEVNNPTNDRILTNNSANDYTPVWSKDGQIIVFTSDRTTSIEVWRMNADGTDPKQITSNRAKNYTPSISPDNKQVVYSTTAGASAGYDLDVINVDGTQQASLFSDGKYNIVPSFSPDGHYIMFASGTTADPQNNKMTYRIDSQGHMLLAITEGSYPVWQP